MGIRSLASNMVIIFTMDTDSITQKYYIFYARKPVHLKDLTSQTHYQSEKDTVLGAAALRTGAAALNALMPLVPCIC